MDATVLRRRARHLSWLTSVPLVVLAILLVAIVDDVIVQREIDAGTAILWNLPMVLYLAAIWFIRRALARLAAGEMFGRVVPGLLSRVGILLFAGGLFSEFGRTLVSLLLLEQPLLHTFDASGLTIAVVGAALALLSQLLGSAADMQDELEGFL